MRVSVRDAKACSMSHLMLVLKNSSECGNHIQSQVQSWMPSCQPQLLLKILLNIETGLSTRTLQSWQTREYGFPERPLSQENQLQFNPKDISDLLTDPKESWLPAMSILESPFFPVPLWFVWWLGSGHHLDMLEYGCSMTKQAAHVLCCF